MESGSFSTSLNLEEYVHVLRRQWRVAVAVAVVGVLAAIGFLAVVPREYTATTTVNLTVISTEPFAARSAPSSLLDDQEERAIAQSHLVAERAAVTMSGVMTASEIRNASSVSTSSGAAVVSVSFSGSSPEQAQAGADAVAGAYLSYRKDRADERIMVLVDGLTGRIDDIEEQVAEIDDLLQTLPDGDPSAARHVTERQQMLSELDGLLAERNSLQSVDTTAGYVLSAANSNAMESTPNSRLTLLSGLAAGLVLGVLAAFLRNPRDRRLRDGEEVARALKAPILARLSGVEGRVPAEGAEADSLRVARERMLGSVRPGDTVIVIDATHSSHIATTALNLAVVTAQSGLRVRLIAPEDPQYVRARMSDVFEPGSSGIELSSGGSLHLDGGPDARDEPLAGLCGVQEFGGTIESADRRTVTFLALTSQSSDASILAAMRFSRSMVVIARDRATTSTEVVWLRDEALAAGTVVIGAINESFERGQGPEARGPQSRAHRREASRGSANMSRESVRTSEPVPAAL